MSKLAIYKIPQPFWRWPLPWRYRVPVLKHYLQWRMRRWIKKHGLKLLTKMKTEHEKKILAGVYESECGFWPKEANDE